MTAGRGGGGGGEKDECRDAILPQRIGHYEACAVNGVRVSCSPTRGVHVLSLMSWPTAAGCR